MFGKSRKFKGPWSNTAELVISQATEIAVTKLVESREISEEELSKKAKALILSTLNDLTLTVALNIWRNAEATFDREERPFFPHTYYKTVKTTLPADEVKNMIKEMMKEDPAWAAGLKMDCSATNGGFKPENNTPRPDTKPEAAKPKKK